jgi:multidrug efflux pump subunit AcrA (membrane-fusion protein)
MVDYQRQVLEAAKAEAARAARSYVDETKTQREQEAQKAQQQELINSYAERAINSGLDAQKLIEAEQVVAAYQPSQDVADFLLSDPNGPHLMNYLADNQTELESLVTLPPMRAALKLEQLRAKALNANKGTKAPDPVEPLSGRGTVDNESPLIKGATFS